MRRTRISHLEPGERRRAEEAERAEAFHPDAAMKRREFLGKTAALAGAAGLATVLPSEALIREAGRLQTRAAALPSPKNMPIDHFVVLMMENRSFDHYFGWHPGADSVNAGLSFPDATGSPVPTHHLPPDFQGCAFRDPDHSWNGGRHQYGNGQMKGFVQGNAAGTGSDEFAAGYYLKNDLGFIPHVAEAFQLHDRFFHSHMGSTYPNRHYMWSAQSGGQKDNEIPATLEGNQWETIFDRALGKGVSARYFASDLPVSALYGQRGLDWTEDISSYYSRAAAGTLPNVSFVDPPFADGGGGDGLSGDEHPHGDVRIGQAFMSDVVHAFLESPQFRNGMLVICYDEWGGFFEHVDPVFVPDDRESKNLYENFGLSGFRIPAVVVSPYARHGTVSHATCLFESVLKLISYRFRLGNLNRRHRYAFNIGRTLDWKTPDFDPPDLPDPVAISDGSCTSQGFPRRARAAEAERASPHDLMLLESSGYLDRLGYTYQPATLDRIFREPDSVGKALRADWG